MADATTMHSSELPDDVKKMFNESTNPGGASSPSLTANGAPRPDENENWSSDDNEEPFERDLICDTEVTLTVLPPQKPRTTVITECTLDASAFQVAQLLAGEMSGEFWDAYMAMTERTEVTYGRWRAYSGQYEMRDITCTQNGLKAPPFIPNVPKSTRCVELQRRALPCVNNFTLESSVQTPDVPLGDHFTIEIRYEVTGIPATPVDVVIKGETVSFPFTRSKLSITMEVSWIKVPWIGKTALESNVQGIVAARHKIFIELLLQKIQDNTLGPVVPMKNQRRRRRGHDSVSQQDLNLIEDSPLSPVTRSVEGVDSMSLYDTSSLQPTTTTPRNPTLIPFPATTSETAPSQALTQTSTTISTPKSTPSLSTSNLNVNRQASANANSVDNKLKEQVTLLVKDVEHLRQWLSLLTIICIVLCLVVLWLWLDVSMIRKIGFKSFKDALAIGGEDPMSDVIRQAPKEL